MRAVRPQPIHLFALAVFLLLGVSGVARHLSGHSHFYDLGVFDNVVWQTLHGRFLYYPQYHMSYLGDHFSPFLLLFVPLYLIWATPAWLILVQAAGLGVSCALLFRIAETELGPTAAARRAAWIFAVLCALHPSTLHVAMFDFHPLSFMIPLSLAAYLCYLRGRRRALVLLLLALLLCKEEAAITVAAFGLYLAAFGRSRADRRLGAITVLGSAAYLVLVMKLLIPAFQPEDARAGWVYLSRYGHLGATMQEVVRTLLLSPLDALVLSWRPFKLETLLWIFAPLGFLPLLGWRALLVALPCLGYTYLSGRTNQFLIQHQYFSPALPWLLIASVQGLGAWISIWPTRRALPVFRRSLGAAGLPLVAALLGAAFAERELHPIKSRYFGKHPYRDELREIRQIVGDASLSATNRLAPPFAHREEFYLALDFPLNRELNAALGLPDYHDTRFHLFELTALDPSQDRVRRIRDLLADPRYGVRYYRFPILLFERGIDRPVPEELAAIVAADEAEDSDRVRAFHAVFLRRSNPEQVRIDLGRNGRDAALRFVPGRKGRVFGPYVIVPAGRYEVDFHLRLEAPAVGRVARLTVVSEFARTVHASREVPADALAVGGPYRPVTLPMRLEGETRDVEFSTRSLGAPISLRKVVLRRMPDAP